MMIPYVNANEILAKTTTIGCNLLTEEDGCVNGCKCGISRYTATEYDAGGGPAHDDQEGFLVLEGTGSALIDGIEYEMKPGICFIVPAGVKHTMKKTGDCKYCKVFWFHAAV